MSHAVKCTNYRNVATRSVCLCLILCGLWFDVVATVDVEKKTVKTGPNHDKVVVCYVTSKATNRPNRGNFTLDDVDPSLCTHLVYVNARVSLTRNSIYSPDAEKASYKKMAAMKKKNPHLKVTLAVGDSGTGSSHNYSKIASEPERRKAFIQSAVNFIRDYNFDGLDLHWMLPYNETIDKTNFVSLVKELRAAFEPNWILTAAFGAGVDTIDTLYDIKALSQHLDLLHVMCYDYHTNLDENIRFNVNTPLLSQMDKKSVMDTIGHFLEMEAPSKKLVLGLAMYGRTYTVDGNTEDGENYFGLPASKGLQGPFTGENGLLGYNEICLEFDENNSTWQKIWDDKTETPYAVQENEVISYDNEASLIKKVKYAIDNQLAGVMIWALDTDDFRGDCDGNRKTTYPLLRAINNAMVGDDNENTAVTASAAKSCILTVVVIATLRLWRV